MGKKSKIRTGTGDIVPAPGPLHKQIEKSIMAKQKFKPQKQFHKEIKDIEVKRKFLTLGIKNRYLVC